MLIIGIHGEFYPIMKEFLIDAFRFQIIQCDNDNISSTLTEISEMIKYGTMNICVDNIKTLKSYRALKCFFGCFIISIDLEINKKIKPDYIIESTRNVIEIRNIIYDLL